MFIKHILRLGYGSGYMLAASPDGVGAAFATMGSKLISNVDPNVLASAAGVGNTINYFLTNVSGTNAMTAIKLPSGFKGMFAVIPSGAFTGATGGAWADDGTTATVPFGKAFTAVVQRALIFFTDGLLIYPIA